MLTNENYGSIVINEKKNNKLYYIKKGNDLK